MAREAPKKIDSMNLPALNMQNFVSKFNELNGPAKACRFAVNIIPSGFMQERLPTNDLLYMCDSAQLPGRGFAVSEVRYYGPSQALPHNTEYETASFSFICRQTARERYFFDEWMNVINPVSSFNFEYASNYWSTIRIYQLAEYSSKDPAVVVRDGRALDQTRASAPDIIYGWTLRRAWPILVSPQQVTWQDQDVLRLQITFTYKNWDREEFQMR